MNKLIKKLGVLFTAGAVAVSSVAYAASAAPETVSTGGHVVAFPGAEGGGMYTTGARGAIGSGDNIEVYHVTNLNDSGEGSFRDAVSKGNRIVVFDVSGYIDLSSNVSIGHDNMTILGQTAPGDGVTFRTNNIKIGADNVILRYLKFRVGAHDASGNDTKAQDGLEITDNCQNVIIDHCSVSWGTDENLSAYAVKDVTIQNSIISEALNQSVHDKGEHSYAAIWGGVNLSIHHNLIATHKSRNPKIGTSETVAMTEGYTDSQTLVDMKNNVFYNWGDKAGYGSENGAKTYIQNNVYRPGPATPQEKRARIFELSVGQKYKTDMFGSVYAAGNIIDVEAGDAAYADAQRVNENNWQDDLHMGVYTDTKFYATGDKTNIKIDTPDEAYQTYNAEYPITLDNTEDVFEKVIANAGATLPKRDKVDERIVSNVVNRTAPNGSSGSVGLLDDPRDGIPAGQEGEYDGRGYPIITSETRDASYDTDGDGLPDTWEDAMGLDKSNPLDSVNIGPDGYTWLEIYVEEEITNPKSKDVSVTLSGFDGVRSENDTVELSASVSGEKAADVAKVEFYCNDEVIGEANSLSGGVASVSVSDIPTGDNNIVAKAIKSDGSYVLSPAVQLCVIGSQGAQGWESSAEAGFDGESYTISTGGAISQSISGDFKLVARVDEISSRNSGVATGIYANGANSESISISTAYNGSYVQEISYEAGGSGTWQGAADISKYKLLEIARTGSTVSLYAGTSVADLEDNLVAETNVTSDTLSVGANVSGSSLTVSKLGMLKLVKEQTSPTVKLQENIGRIGLTGDSVDVTVTSDANSPVNEIWLYLDGTPVTSQQVYITGTQTISIPVTFTTPQRGTLTAYCFDENLGRGSDSQTVAVSQDPSPWELTDIGGADEVSTSYVSVTDDYTYKISGIEGSVGSDEFTYLNQKFSDDMRMYYRSRMQGSSQFGIMLRSSLDSGAASYFFGGIVGSDGSLKYQLIKRAAGSSEAQVIADVTDVTGTSANLYFIAEKIDNVINIYQTENGATVYTTKNLLTSVLCDDLSDEYYMGYAAVSGGGNPPDAGWVGLEGIITGSSNDLYIESYQDGIVTISESSNFDGGTLIVCGYDEDGALADSIIADMDGFTKEVGQVSGSSYKVFLWNNLEQMVPLCEAYDGTSSPSVSGGSEAVVWNFDYGLDWLWQMQEKNVLRPSWTKGISGNESGIMAIEPSNDYASNGDRYIFREYRMSDDYVPQFSCSFLATGDEPAINLYFQTGKSDQAYKVTFSDDGNIYANGSALLGQWDSADGWYSVYLVTDIDETGEIAANLSVSNQDGTTVVENAPIEISGPSEFRAQINTEKKNPVTQAVYFEPVAGASGKYYIDDVMVEAVSPSVRVEKETSWYTFDKISAISGAFTVDGLTDIGGTETSGYQMSVAAGAELKTGSKSVEGISFTNRIRIKNNNGKITVPVKDGSVITVYGASANSSSARPLYINNVKYSIQPACASEYVHTGGDGTIEIYGGDNIEIYGVKVETVSVFTD